MPHRTKESQTESTDLTATLSWDVALVEPSRRIFLRPCWWYMPADTTAAQEIGLPIATTYVYACKFCSKAEGAVTDREVSRS